MLSSVSPARVTMMCCSVPMAPAAFAITVRLMGTPGGAGAGNDSSETKALACAEGAGRDAPKRISGGRVSPAADAATATDARSGAAGAAGGAALMVVSARPLSTGDAGACRSPNARASRTITWVKGFVPCPSSASCSMRVRIMSRSRGNCTGGNRSARCKSLPVAARRNTGAIATDHPERSDVHTVPSIRIATAANKSSAASHLISTARRTKRGSDVRRASEPK
jgi:hypothetical protein